MVDRTVPNLPSRDFTATAEFYGRFGFVETYHDEGWMILRREALQLEFFAHPELDPRTSSFMCSIRVADLDSLFGAIAMQRWGQRAGFLIDIDGTQLHLIQDTEHPKGGHHG